MRWWLLLALWGRGNESDSPIPQAGNRCSWSPSSDGEAKYVLPAWVSGALFGKDVRLVAPEALWPDPALVARCEALAAETGGSVTVTSDVAAGVDGCDFIHTDVWVSMGGDVGSREKDFAPYQVTAEVMRQAAGDAVFMHCLPAFRGREVTAEVIDGLQSVVFDEAENRLHAQKAVLAWCFADD